MSSDGEDIFAEADSNDSTAQMSRISSLHFMRRSPIPHYPTHPRMASSPLDAELPDQTIDPRVADPAPTFFNQSHVVPINTFNPRFYSPNYPYPQPYIPPPHVRPVNLHQTAEQLNPWNPYNRYRGLDLMTAKDSGFWTSALDAHLSNHYERLPRERSPRENPLQPLHVIELSSSDDEETVPSTRNVPLRYRQKRRRCVDCDLPYHGDCRRSESESTSSKLLCRHNGENSGQNAALNLSNVPMNLSNPRSASEIANDQTETKPSMEELASTSSVSAFATKVKEEIKTEPSSVEAEDSNESTHVVIEQENIKKE